MFGRIGVLETDVSTPYGYGRLLPLLQRQKSLPKSRRDTYIIARGSFRKRKRTPWSEKALERYVDSSIPLKSLGSSTAMKVSSRQVVIEA